MDDEKHPEKMSRGPGLSRSLLSQHDVLYSKPTPIEWVVVRIEVTDTGCGIRPKDMVQTKLFCEYREPCGDARASFSRHNSS
jgi:osomolarity two-component system, sensor histidine kinase SLN1